MGKGKKSETRKTVKEVKKMKGKSVKKAKAKEPVKAKQETKPVTKPAPKPVGDELESLRKPVEAARAGMEKAEKEAKALNEKARALVADAKQVYHAALVPYRDACKKAGVQSEFHGGRIANVSERVTFIVEKTDKGVKVAIKGRPETEEVIPDATLKESVNKAAYGYTDKHLGPRQEIGNKGGGLSNRLRRIMAR